MALVTASNMIQGQSLKTHFMPICELALFILDHTERENFSKKTSELGQLDGFGK